MYAYSMKRTQIYLPETIHRRLKQLALQHKRAMADIVRDILEQELHVTTERDDSGVSVLRDVADIKGAAGPADLSTNLDHYLYGGPKKKKHSR